MMSLDIILTFLFFSQGPNTFFLCATCEQRTPERSSLSPDMLNLWLTWRWKVYTIYICNERRTYKGFSVCDTTC